jgi:hypothetical protein
MAITIGMVGHIRPWSKVVATMAAIAIMLIASVVAVAIISSGLRVS